MNGIKPAETVLRWIYIYNNVIVKLFFKLLVIFRKFISLSKIYR